MNVGKKKSESFEDLLRDTEELVDALESGELSLDESLKTYDNGIKNLARCAELLEQAEQKVQVLLETTGDAPQFEELDDTDEEDD